MRRQIQIPRADWQQKVEDIGFIFHSLENEPYWDESAAYLFTSKQIDQLESVTNELHQMCFQAVDYIIKNNRFADFGISSDLAKIIESEWDAEPPTLYGRFDFGYDGYTDPKLFEYNADTPTSLLEAAVAQWHWLQEVHPGADQFNSIWECLIEQWTWLKDNNKLKWQTIHFASQDHWEDLMTVAVLRDTADQAGLKTESLLMEEIGWNEIKGEFRDLKEKPIETIFKLYPWEFMVKDKFGENAVANLHRTQWIEPIWKMLLSNKALLAILWEMFPNHPNLLPTYLNSPRDLTQYVSKPILGREGSNVEIVSNFESAKTDGPYFNERKVFQEFYDQKSFAGNRPVIGSWVVGETSCGISIRETTNLVTDDLARFIPHLIWN
jgi:glutathionylspermidine synthase